MSAFLYQMALQWKMGWRDKSVLVTYYAVPLLFFLFMGSIFSSIMPDARGTLVQSMSVFAVTMGGVIGAPGPLLELYGRDMRRTCRAGGLPLWAGAVCHILSSAAHLLLASALILLLAPLLFEAALPAGLLRHILTLLLLILASLCVGCLFGLFFQNTSKLTMAAQTVFLPSILLSGIMVPPQMLPEALQYAGLAFPATWGYRALCAQEAGGALVALAAFCLCGAVGIALRLKRMARD